MPRQAEWNTLRGGTQQRFFFLELARVAKIEPTTVAPMKTSTKIFTVAGALVLAHVRHSGRHARAGKSIHRPRQSSNGRQGHSHSESFLYTQGSDPAALEFYKMMQSGEAGEKISKIELVNLTREEIKKATTPMDGPTGKVCLNLKPTKKLVTKVEKKDASGGSSSSSENFVVEKDGKFVIPVPGACK